MSPSRRWPICPGDVAETIRLGLDAADGTNLEIFSPSIGTLLLERGLLDEVDLHVLPRLLGDGTRLRDALTGPCASCKTWVGDDRNAATDVRFHATYEG